MYRLVISPRAQKHLKKLKKGDELPVKLAIEEIKEDPMLGKPLSRELNQRYSYRFGGYRIIYKINEKGKTISVLSAKHRSIVYN
jgi:mRNA-degrading endonuclease RelE of RelBE toxin-antitoxin system